MQSLAISEEDTFRFAAVECEAVMTEPVVKCDNFEAAP